MIKATKQMIARDVAALPENYKTKDVDALIARYVKEKYDVSCLRGCVLAEQEFHRIYYYVSLKQIKNHTCGTPERTSRVSSVSTA